jgi:hypothetical protein
VRNSLYFFVYESIAPHFCGLARDRASIQLLPLVLPSGPSVTGRIWPAAYAASGMV